MAELYENCAKEVLVTIDQFNKGVQKVSDAFQKLQTDKRYTPNGKKEIAGKLNDELKELSSEKSQELKDIITKFAKTYRVNPIDENAESQDVANVLKVIEMCGNNLTVEVLENALRPLMASQSSLKMVEGVLTSKIHTGAVYDYITELVNGNNTVFVYQSYFDQLDELLNADTLLSAYLPNGLAGATGSGVVDNSRYEVYALGDTMMEIGKRYASLKANNPRMFR